MPYYTNAKPNVPKLFKEIIRNHAESETILAKGDKMNQAEWVKLKELRTERIEYRRAAEKALHWNADKGNTA